MAAISRSRALGALLLAWTGLALAAGSLVDTSDARTLLPVLAGLVAALALWRPFPYAGAFLSTVAAGAYALVHVLVAGADSLLLPGLVALFGLLGVGLLADALAFEHLVDVRQRHHDAQLIEELTPTRNGEGVLKWGHVAHSLAGELSRARRYRYPVTFALVGLENWERLHEERGRAEAARLRTRVASILATNVRTSDRVGYHGDRDIAVLLPHTPLAGMLTVLDKCRLAAREELGVELRSGVAEFPADAASPEDLLREAEAALEFARTSGLGVASRALLNG